MNAMRKAQEAAQLAADYWMGYEGTTGVRGDKERAQEAEHSMFKWATLAQAEAAERQAAAMERIAAHLEGQHYSPPWVQDMRRLTDKMMEYVILPEERAALAKLVNAAIRDGAAAGLEDDGQRDEDEQGYNAGIAPGLHR